MPMLIFLDSKCNNRTIKHIGSSVIGAVTLPDHDIFPLYLVTVAISSITLALDSVSTLPI